MDALDLRSARESVELERRLREVPAEAAIRGIWFVILFQHVRRLGKVEMMTWKRATAARRRLPFRYYPMREYLDELVVAGALTVPSDPAEGMRRIWQAATPAGLATPFGRALLHLVRPNPVRYMQWLVDHRDQFCNYGVWRLRRHDTTYVTMEMHNEYLFIDSAHRGGAEGLLKTCGLEGVVEPELSGPYEGRLHVRWRPFGS